MGMQKMLKKLLMGTAAVALSAGAAQAQISGDTVKIGVLTDKSSLYADVAGEGSVVAAQLAVEEFGGKAAGKPVQVISADHQNKADISSNIARQWFDTEGVDAIADLVTSSTALAVQEVARDKTKVTLISGAATSRLTGDACSPTGFHWAYDTYALAVGTGRAVVRNGGKSWFFLTADYAFGHSLENDAATVVKANGGRVVGTVRHPLNASDFSSFLLQAQGSKAQILALANAGGDFTNAVKAAKEFGINKTMKVAGLLVFINDVHSLGLNNTEGLQLADSWYWNQDDASRKFAQRFFDKYKRMPSSLQAANYSATMTYLKAVQAAGTTDADKVMAQAKSTQVNDFYSKGKIRQDGRMIHEMSLFQVKGPKESTTPWDYYKLVAKVPGEQAFTTLADSKCALVKK
jgi:branched-chain amino acid transport system substrate-binding protein